MSRRIQVSALGFTLIELMVVIALMAILVVLAVPSFDKMIVMQRLRGTNAQLITDLQLARSEATMRGTFGRVNFGTDANQTCYTIYVTNGSFSRCDCTLGAGSACTVDSATTTEVRTVQIPRSTGVTVIATVPTPAGGTDTAFGYDPVTGGLMLIPTDIGASPLGSVRIESRVDDDRRLVNTIIQSGRPSVCAPNASVMQVTAC